MKVVAWFLLVCCALLLACGDDDAGGGGKDAGGDGGGKPDSGAPIATGDGGLGAGGTDGAVPPFVPPTTPPTPMSCGGEMCPALTMTDATAGTSTCCTDDDACGVTTALISTPTCLPRDSRGSVNLGCADLIIDPMTALPGCCTEDGQCGVAALSAGCVANALVNMPDRVPEQSCTYDAESTCNRLLELVCDGAEDCDDGEVCCGQYASGYKHTRCSATCVELETDPGGTWAELCHPGDTCLDPDALGYECRANSMFLPDFIYRCRDTGTTPTTTGNTAAGKVNCGFMEDADSNLIRQVCGAGEKCCVSYPTQTPQCVAADEPCSCATASSDADGGI